MADLSPESWVEQAKSGERSLLARGLLVEDHDGLLRASDELRSILILREEPLTVCLFEVLADGAIVSSATFYGGGTDEFVLEEVAQAGDHRFALRDPAAAARALAEELDPLGRAGPSDGEPLVRLGDREPDGWEAAQRTIDSPERSARVYSVRRVTEERVEDREAAIVVGPEGVFLTAGKLDPHTGEAEVSATPLSRVLLEDRLRRHVCAAD
jgi:hypothetical protein